MLRYDDVKKPPHAGNSCAGCHDGRPGGTGCEGLLIGVRVLMLAMMNAAHHLSLSLSVSPSHIPRAAPLLRGLRQSCGSSYQGSPRSHGVNT